MNKIEFIMTGEIAPEKLERLKKMMEARKKRLSEIATKYRNEMKATDVQKELLKTGQMAKFSHYMAGNLFYTVQLEEGMYMFPVATVEYTDDKCSLSSDLGDTPFEAEIKASFLNRWVKKAIENDEFIKLK